MAAGADMVAGRSRQRGPTLTQTGISNVDVRYVILLVQFLLKNWNKHQAKKKSDINHVLLVTYCAVSERQSTS